jgi:hypothetical protein
LNFSFGLDSFAEIKAALREHIRTASRPLLPSPIPASLPANPAVESGYGYKHLTWRMFPGAAVVCDLHTARPGWNFKAANTGWNCGLSDFPYGIEGMDCTLGDRIK